MPPEAAKRRPGQVGRPCQAADGGRRQSACRRGRARRAARRRQRGRCAGRGADRARPGRAAILRASAAAAFLTWYDAGDRHAHHLRRRARRRRPRRRRTCSSAPTASRSASSTRSSAAARSACPACRACSKRCTSATASSPGRSCSQPAIDLAEDGFEVSPRLHASIAEDVGRLDQQPATRGYFFDARRRAAGGRRDARATRPMPRRCRRSPRTAPSHSTTGRSPQDIVAAVAAIRPIPGRLSLADLAGYQVKERPAVCAPYRGYEVCGMGPPSSGAMAIGQILGLVEPFDIATLGPDDPESWRIIGDATRLAFADRERYIADSDFVSMPPRACSTRPTSRRARS